MTPTYRLLDSNGHVYAVHAPEETKLTPLGPVGAPALSERGTGKSRPTGGASRSLGGRAV